MRTIGDKSSEQTPSGTSIITRHHVDIEQVLQGALGSEQVDVITEGGITENGGLIVSHVPYFSKGKRYYVELEPNTNISSNDIQEILEAAFIHEIGHAYQLQHAHAVFSPQSSIDPLMKAEVDASSTDFITHNDGVGGDRIFGNSASIIATTSGSCIDLSGAIETLSPMENGGGCGAIVSSVKSTFAKVDKFPFALSKNSAGNVILNIFESVDQILVSDILGRELYQSTMDIHQHNFEIPSGIKFVVISAYSSQDVFSMQYYINN